ncbi:hypothetical protein U9M48_016262, partial [Paspalum notatum var. saurae]
MTGVELVTCLEEGDNSLSLINAFVQCLKCDDKNAGHNRNRIIIPPQYQNGEEVVEMIAKELAAEGIADGKKLKQPFLICPILHHGEWFVFFVNSETKDQDKRVERVLLLLAVTADWLILLILIGAVPGEAITRALRNCLLVE